MTSSSHHHLALPVGYGLENYQILRVLGQGGFGITYLAKDTHLDREVAIKEMFHPESTMRGPGHTIVPKSEASRADFEWARQSFIREAKTLARLNHPNIVKVDRLLEKNGTAYMVMAFVHGRNLEEWLRGRAQLDERQVRAILLPLLEGLSELHALGILHRDISPENIFISDKGQPILIDFGNARANLGQAVEHSALVMRRDYSPPELFANATRQGPYTDFYSLAGTMIRAITGQAPPGAYDRVAGPDPYAPLLRTHQGRYSPALLKSIDQAFAIRSADRPQTVQEWRRQLAKPRTPSPAPSPWAPIRWLIGGAVGLAASILLGVLLLGPQQGGTSAPGATPTPTPWPAPVTVAPTRAPTLAPTLAPTRPPIVIPTAVPTRAPTPRPTPVPTAQPTVAPATAALPDIDYVTIPVLGGRFSAHSVRVKDFRMFVDDLAANPELRQKLWGSEELPSKWRGPHSNPVVRGDTVYNGDEYPVVMVSCKEAEAFCRWLSNRLSAQQGREVRVRLPTWQEWSSVRGESKYPWGSSPSPADASRDRVANVKGKNLALAKDFPRNGLGLYQIGTNVEEWTSSRNDGGAYVVGAPWTSRIVDEEGSIYTGKVIDPKRHSPIPLDTWHVAIGFRCVIEADPSGRR